MDRQGPPNSLTTRCVNRFRQQKRCYDVTLSRQEGSMMRHLGNAQCGTGSTRSWICFPPNTLFRCRQMKVLQRCPFMNYLPCPRGQAMCHWIFFLVLSVEICVHNYCVGCCSGFGVFCCYWPSTPFTGTSMPPVAVLLALVVMKIVRNRCWQGWLTRSPFDHQEVYQGESGHWLYFEHPEGEPRTDQ